MDFSIFRHPNALFAGLGASLSLNVVLLGVTLWPDSPAIPEESAEMVFEADNVVDDAPEVVADSQDVAPVAPMVVEGVAEVAAPAAPLAAAPVDVAPSTESADGIHTTFALVKNSIPQTLATVAAPYGDNVSATLSRLLVWDMDLRKDLRGGDMIEAMWSLGTSDVVVIEAARFQSQKLNKTITAYRYQAAGDAYPSYWSADGVEIPHNLRKSPLKEYEQITSLLKDRPTHHGMDFKVDVGTPIYASFDGVVTRVNWNTAANGGCIEVEHNDGVLAKYLHLSDTKVKAGTRVRPGDVIALSGNTGRSTGPHLHYQLNKGTKVIDPITYHGTDRRSLPEADRAQFNELVSAANARLDAARTLASN